MSARSDTDMGGKLAGFPLTKHSAVVASGSDDPQVRRQAFDALVASYWKPVYKYVRVRWNRGNDDAKDLTQGFFVDALQRGLFARYQPGKAAFRTYLRTCLDGYVANQIKAAGRLKRGGGVGLLSLDFDGAEGELTRQASADPRDPEVYFHREWVRDLFAAAVTELSRQCADGGKGMHFELFRRYDLDEPAPGQRPTYEQLAAELGLTTTQVTNYLAAVRREFRRVVLERLRAATGSEEEFRAEAQAVLGLRPEG